MNIEKMRRMRRAEEQRARILRGEIIFRPNVRIVRIVDYKARKARQAIWGNESTSEKCAERS